METGFILYPKVNTRTNAGSNFTSLKHLLRFSKEQGNFNNLIFFAGEIMKSDPICQI